MFAIFGLRGTAAEKHVPAGPTGLKVDNKKRALIDVRAEITADLQKKIRNLGGAVESISVEWRSIIAWVPILRIGKLAEDPAVIAIVPKAEAAKGL